MDKQVKFGILLAMTGNILVECTEKDGIFQLGDAGERVLSLAAARFGSLADKIQVLNASKFAIAQLHRLDLGDCEMFLAERIVVHRELPENGVLALIAFSARRFENMLNNSAQSRGVGDLTPADTAELCGFFGEILGIDFILEP